MLNKLIQAVRGALGPRWDARLPDIVAESKAAAVDLGAEEVYRMAYRKAYWDAVVDLAESGLLRMPEEHPMRVLPETTEFH